MLIRACSGSLGRAPERVFFRTGGVRAMFQNIFYKIQRMQEEYWSTGKYTLDYEWENLSYHIRHLDTDEILLERRREGSSRVQRAYGRTGMTTGEILEELRRDAGLTQQQVGDLLHIGRISASGFYFSDRLWQTAMAAPFSDAFPPAYRTRRQGLSPGTDKAADSLGRLYPAALAGK